MAIDLLIDGLDLSGKTTMANNFAKASGIDYRINNNKLSRINPIHDFAAKMSDSNLYHDAVIGKLYLAGLMNDIYSYVDDGVPTIQDGTVATKSIAYHIVRKTPFILDELQDLLKKYPNPKEAIYLYASIDERIKRLEKRKQLKPETVTRTDLLMTTDPKRFEHTERVLREISMDRFKSKFIDTTKISEQEVLQEIMAVTK
jgi:cytidylate kinase